MIKWVCIALVWIWIFSSFLRLFFLSFSFLWSCSWPIQISLIFSKSPLQTSNIFILRFVHFFIEPFFWLEDFVLLSLFSFLKLTFYHIFFFLKGKIHFSCFYWLILWFSWAFSPLFSFNDILNLYFHLNYLKLSLKSFFTGAQWEFVQPYLAGTLLWTSILFWVGQLCTLFSRCAFVWIWYKSAKL